jgi:nucleoside-diphosphate-sugar epimerase
MSDRVVVTGATGFIGRHVLSALEARGANVTAVDHRWADPVDLDHQLGPAPIVRCIHLGWYSSPADYLVARRPNLQSLSDSLALVDALAARDCRHLLVVGTSAEYAPIGRPVTETDLVRPWSAYGASKVALSTLLESSWCPDSLSIAWARPFNMAGPGESPARLLPTVVRSLLNGHALGLSQGNQVRDFLDVRDVAAALTALSEATATGPFNISSGRGVTLRDLLTQLGQLVGNVGLLQFGARAYTQHDAAYLVGNNRRLTTSTDWRRQISLGQMLDDLLRYWRHRV